MLQFSKIDKDFQVYKGKKVFLFGAGKTGEKLKQDFDLMGIEVEAFVDNDDKKAGQILSGGGIITFIEMKSRIQENEAYVIQISSRSHESEIAMQLDEIGANYIWYSDYFSRRAGSIRKKMVDKNPELKQYIYDMTWFSTYANYEKECINYLIYQEKYGKDNINLILGPAKTGNNTLALSCEENAVFMAHSRTYVDKIKKYLEKKQVNLILGVRDVISQNFSLLFEYAKNALFYWDLDEYWNLGGDVQTIFDKYIIGEEIEKEYFFRFMNDKRQGSILIQNFFEQQIEPLFGIDIYKYPFDTEKGYSIYDFGKLKIMVYQLEKMDSLEQEIGSFLEIGDFKLKRDNQAKNKWYFQAYEDAKKNIHLKKEYFEECYTGKFMNHFYSQEDIEKFKNKWIGNVH